MNLLKNIFQNKLIIFKFKIKTRDSKSKNE